MFRLGHRIPTSLINVTSSSERFCRYLRVRIANMEARGVELAFPPLCCVCWIANSPLYSVKTGIIAPLILVDIMLY